MKKYKDQVLSNFRDEIDGIDRKIIDLLKDRFELIEKVKEHKKSLGENFYISSSREADMLKKLVECANESIPDSIIVSIWRKIITSANVLEQPIKIAIHNPKKRPEYSYIVKDYYSDLIPIEIHDSVTNIISAIEKNEVQIGIFALPNEKDEANKNSSDNWWINLAGGGKNNIRVFAKIPFVESSSEEKGVEQINLVAVAIKNAEKSLEDRTLLLAELELGIPKSQLQEAIKDSGLEGRIIKTAKIDQVESIGFNLIEIEGFFEQDDPKIMAFSKTKIRPYVKIIGSYPKPIRRESKK